MAVSWYRIEYTASAIERLVDAGEKTNIHYVLSRNTTAEAVERLKSDDFPKGVYAVIFLSYKPVGQGSAENILHFEDEITTEFFNQPSLPHRFKVGVDSSINLAFVKLDLESSVAFHSRYT